MLTCSNCGESFDISSDCYIDDHMELCPKCADRFRNLGKEDPTDV